MKKLMIMLPLTALLLGACNPQPQSCIKTSATTLRVNEGFNFESCSEDASRLIWSFGDGTTAEGNVVSHAYTTPGVYQVELKALSKKDKKWDRSTLIVNVSPAKNRYLTRISLTSYNITNPSGATWDVAPAQNPDIFLSFGIEGAANSQQTNTVAEVALNMLPIFWDFTGNASQPLLSNTNWVIGIHDNDSVLQANPVNETMATFTVNPATATISAPGKITLTQSNFQLELDFIEL